MTKPTLHTFAITKDAIIEALASNTDCLHCLVSEVLLAWQKTHPGYCARRMMFRLYECIGDIVTTAPEDLRDELRALAIDALPQIIDGRNNLEDSIIIERSRKPH